MLIICFLYFSLGPVRQDHIVVMELESSSIVHQTFLIMQVSILSLLSLQGIVKKYLEMIIQHIIYFILQEQT